MGGSLGHFSFVSSLVIELALDGFELPPLLVDLLFKHKAFPLVFDLSHLLMLVIDFFPHPSNMFIQ